MLSAYKGILSRKRNVPTRSIDSSISLNCLFWCAANRCDSCGNQKVSQISFIFYCFWSAVTEANICQKLSSFLGFYRFRKFCFIKLPLLDLTMDLFGGDVSPLCDLTFNYVMGSIFNVSYKDVISFSLAIITEKILRKFKTSFFPVNLQNIDFLKVSFL